MSKDEKDENKETKMRFDADIQRLRTHMDYLHESEQRRIGDEHYSLVKSQTAELQYLRNRETKHLRNCEMYGESGDE